MSKGITRSYEPIGTIARGEPLVDVLKTKRCAPRQAPSTVLVTENFSAPGAM